MNFHFEQPLISVPSIKFLHIWGMGKFSTAQILSSCISNPVSSLLLIHIQIKPWFSSVQFTSVAQSCPTLYDPTNRSTSVAQSCPTLYNPMNRSTPGLPVHHQLPEFTQTHVHWVGDTIQPSHPLLSTSPPAPSPSQHQGLFQWVTYWPFIPTLPE